MKKIEFQVLECARCSFTIQKAITENYNTFNAQDILDSVLSEHEPKQVAYCLAITIYETRHDNSIVFSVRNRAWAKELLENLPEQYTNKKMSYTVSNVLYFLTVIPQNLLNLVTDSFRESYPDLKLETEEQDNVHSSDTFIRLSNAESETQEFLWNPYIPIGEITVMYASEGIGKTFAAIGIASDITAGRSLPKADGCQTASNPEKVLLISTDDNESVILPRMKEAGGNPDNCFVLKTPQTLKDLKTDSFILPQNKNDTVRIQAFADSLKTVQPKLVIIDTWSAYISNNTNANNIREVVNILTALAKEFHCAMLIITNDTVPDCKTLIHSAHSALRILPAASDVSDPYNHCDIIQTKPKCQTDSDHFDAVCYHIINQGKNKVARFEWAGFTQYYSYEVHC